MKRVLTFKDGTQFLNFMTSAFYVVRPWRENPKNVHLQDDFQKGWNACVEEQKKRADAYVHQMMLLWCDMQSPESKHLFEIVKSKGKK